MLWGEGHTTYEGPIEWTFIPPPVSISLLYDKVEEIWLCRVQIGGADTVDVPLSGEVGKGFT